MLKKVIFLIGSLAFFNFLAKAQPEKKHVYPALNKLDIELVYNHYTQDGNNSAVTGGEGTEKLTVYGPKLSLKRTKKNTSIGLTMGADIISSASTDNIDFVMSSVSVLDMRTYATVGMDKIILNNQLTLSGAIGFSVESDYASIHGKLGVAHQNKNNLRNLFLEVSIYDDDLRWGRINKKYYRPIKLIYPAELRYKEWYDDTKRKTYNIKFGFSQPINQRNVLAIMPQITLQRGLLATPFHRIYFTNGMVGVEQLPKERNKFGLSAMLNSFVGGKTILKNGVQLYTDNFGINAIALENETVFKVSPSVALGPNVRWYAQSESKYFAPLGEHEYSANFFTSDYDLSKFNTIQIGAVAKFKPFRKVTQKLFFNTVILRYAYMQRSNQLSAHIVSIGFQLAVSKNEM